MKGITKEITALKAENTVLKTRLTEAETEIVELKLQITDKSDKIGKLEPVVNNNLRYLINHSRDEKRHNIIVFGVPEHGELKLTGIFHAKEDEEKYMIILKGDCFRLGIVNENETGKPRPIKIKYEYRFYCVQ